MQMARCVERSNVFCPGMSKPTLPKIRADALFSEDYGVEVEVFQPFVPPIGFGRSTKAIGVLEKVWKKMRGCRGEEKNLSSKGFFFSPCVHLFSFSESSENFGEDRFDGGVGEVDGVAFHAAGAAVFYNKWEVFAAEAEGAEVVRQAA